MAGANARLQESAPLDFSVPDGGPSPNMHALSEQNGLGSLKLNDVQATTTANTGDKDVKQLDLGSPIESSKSTDAPKPNERGETSIDLKFDSYDLPDGGKLLVGQSQFQKTPFKPIILDKDGKYVETRGGGGGGGSGPNGERLPEFRSNDYANGAWDRYTEGDNKYHYTDAKGKTQTIELKDKIEFGDPSKSEASSESIDSVKDVPKVQIDPSKPIGDQLKQIMSAGGKEVDVKAEQYDLPNGEKLVTWDLNGNPGRPFVMDKNGALDFETGGGGGGGGGDGTAPNEAPKPMSNSNSYSNGATGQWNDGSNTYTYTDKSGNQTVIQLRKPM